MEGFADLLTDAFSETSVPSLPDGDLDFESLNLDEKCEEEEETENLTAKEDGALLQEATGEAAVLFGEEAKDMLYSAENEEQTDDKSDEEDYAGVNTPEEDYTSSDGDSEQEDSVSGEDEDNEEEEEEEEEGVGAAEEPGDLLMSVQCSDEFHDEDKEDRVYAEGRPLALEAAENPQVRNKEQGEAESDEEEAYFGRLPEGGGEMMIKGVGAEEDEKVEEKQEDSSDPEWEGMKIEKEENVLAQDLEQEVESPYGDDPTTASSEFPSISLQNLQDLIAEVDNEKYEEKMKDFSGEEHQEAGESFADYPSDFSSCEYTENGGKNQESKCKSNAPSCTSDCGSYSQQDTCLEVVEDLTSSEDTDRKEDEYLYSRDLETEADRLMSLDVAAGEEDGGKTEDLSGNAAVTWSDDGDETGGSDSYSSSEDEYPLRRNNEELLGNMCQQDPENIKPDSGSSTECHDNPRAEPADFLSWDFDVLKSDNFLSEYLLEEPDKAGTHPGEDVSSYSAVQREDSRTTSSSYQGSLDDSFFFNTGIEASGVDELGTLGEDEYEEERNWEQEQERIQAFYRFYDDSDEDNGREGRQTKVQFCADPLSRVIHYETDSSDRDSLSSSSDREENPSSTETSDEQREPEVIPQMKPACDPPNMQLQDLSTTRTCTGKHKSLGMLKLILKMGLVTAMGLLMFWLTTDQADWIRQIFFF
ncbi:dentin sialophosphoprotein isoform X2 [Stegastes partitus]|nr:PREDICTED: dentin sialophosphoprotein-like isoform X2 [Stegastes partitus]XP_008294136.1 PREDICTED: dentin sialophosphoprotein-like isoform X2 [Stegastes partitus]